MASVESRTAATSGAKARSPIDDWTARLARALPQRFEVFETRFNSYLQEHKLCRKLPLFLWFDNNAEEAMNFYTSIFKNSKIGSVSRYGDAGPGPKGTVMAGTFYLDGQ